MTDLGGADRGSQMGGAPEGHIGCLGGTKVCGFGRGGSGVPEGGGAPEGHIGCLGGTKCLNDLSGRLLGIGGTAGPRRLVL